MRSFINLTNLIPLHYKALQKNYDNTIKTRLKTGLNNSLQARIEKKLDEELPQE